MPGNQTPLLDPVSAAWHAVARFDDYPGARRAVGRLSGDGLPAGRPGIAGSDARLAEPVTGRRTEAAS
jgi:hypothetical protein